jgi:hypothetical protein
MQIEVRVARTPRSSQPRARGLSKLSVSVNDDGRRDEPGQDLWVEERPFGGYVNFL